MLAAKISQQMNVAENRNFSSAVEWIVNSGAEEPLAELLSKLSPAASWGDRQTAAKRLGYMRAREALPVLLTVLLTDPFWMVRCAVVQALDLIGDPAALPALQEAARRDNFQAVRTYAARAIARLSQI